MAVGTTMAFVEGQLSVYRRFVDGALEGKLPGGSTRCRFDAAHAGGLQGLKLQGPDRDIKIETAYLLHFIHALNADVIAAPGKGNIGRIVIGRFIVHDRMNIAQCVFTHADIFDRKVAGKYRFFHDVGEADRSIELTIGDQRVFLDKTYEGADAETVEANAERLAGLVGARLYR